MSLSSVSKSWNRNLPGVNIAATVRYISAHAKLMPTQFREPLLKLMMYFCRRLSGLPSASSQRSGMKVRGEGYIVGFS